MAKLSKDELLKKITERVTDEDLVIELMEDISDSIVENETESEEISKLKADNEKLSADYADLKERYKNRFLSSEVEVEEKTEEKTEEESEPEEKEVIDVKEI